MIFRLTAIILPFALVPTVSLAQNQKAAPPREDRPPVSGRPGENEFSVSLTMFTTLAAINAAGYDTGLDSPLNQTYKLRQQIRTELASRKIPCLPELKDFYRAHKKPSPAADLGQYLSFALVAGDAPTFELPSGELPPDVEPLKDFSGILVRFYKEANIEDLWNRSQQAYAAVVSEYQDPVINSLFEANGYLRNPSGYLGRRFQIYLDLLAAPDQVQVRSYRDDYFVVVTPTSTPVVDEIRDAYLAYVLDPLSFKYSDAIKQKKVLQKYAEDAPALELPYKDDFSLLVTKCLIKAIDSRLMHEGTAARETYINEAMREGFILTEAFADFLPAYEKQPDAFRIYYPNLINAIDVKHEEKRLKNIQFVQSLPQKVIAPPAKMELDPAEQALESAEGLYEQGDYEHARDQFKQALQRTSDKSMQGRAYYGLARIAVRENQKDEAVTLFERTAEFNPNPAITAWSHVYLGRLALASGNTNKASDQFKAALAINGASAMAREAAEKGLESTSSSGDKQQ